MSTTAEISAQTAPELLIDHNLTDAPMDAGVLFEMRPARTPDGEEVEGLFNAWMKGNLPPDADGRGPIRPFQRHEGRR